MIVAELCLLSDHNYQRAVQAGVLAPNKQVELIAGIFAKWQQRKRCVAQQ
jgi:hypothetical protein